MGHRARVAALIALAALTAACGDPFVVIGDSPGVLRIVAGVPDSAGNSLAERATESLLNEPHGIAAGADGMIYIADKRNARLLAISPSGEVAVLVDHSDRSEEPRLRDPDGLALSGASRLVISDPTANRVWQLDIESRELTPLAGTGNRGTAPDTVDDALAADLNRPTGVAIGPEGGIYFSELEAHRVRCIEPGGVLVTFAGTGARGFKGDSGPARLAEMNRPAGLALGTDSLYIADSGNHRIRVVDLGTALIHTVAGSGVGSFSGDGGPATEAALYTPAAVAFSPGARKLYIGDTDNHRVRVVDLETLTIATFAGTGDVVFNGDLRAAGETALMYPRGIAVSPFQMLYISDTGHHIVRRTAIAFLTQ